MTRRCARETKRSGRRHSRGHNDTHKRTMRAHKRSGAAFGGGTYMHMVSCWQYQLPVMRGSSTKGTCVLIGQCSGAPGRHVTVSHPRAAATHICSCHSFRVLCNATPSNRKLIAGVWPSLCPVWPVAFMLGGQTAVLARLCRAHGASAAAQAERSSCYAILMTAQLQLHLLLWLAHACLSTCQQATTSRNPLGPNHTLG